MQNNLHVAVAAQVALERRLETIAGNIPKRGLRRMGGCTPGADPILDRAIRSAPQICEAMHQSPDAPPSEDPFVELAAALRGESKGEA